MNSKEVENTLYKIDFLKTSIFSFLVENSISLEHLSGRPVIIPSPFPLRSKGPAFLQRTLIYNRSLAF